jgi:hypothetical protein
MIMSHLRSEYCTVSYTQHGIIKVSKTVLGIVYYANS